MDARDYFVKMRKSLGDKRKEISAAQIEEITRLYADFTEGEKVKIFPNKAFGFQRITVERPLRLRWEVTDDTIAAVMATKAWSKLPRRAEDARGRWLALVALRDRRSTEGRSATSSTPGSQGQ